MGLFSIFLLVGPSGRPDVGQERIDLGPQQLGFAAQRVGGLQDFAGRAGGAFGL